MREWQSQSHVRWYCRYHVVWVPKYRKRAIFDEMRRGIGENRSGAVSAAGRGVGRRARAVGSRACVVGHPAEVQRGEHGGVSEREVGDPHPSGASGAATQLHGLPLLGARVLRQHGRFGRRGHPRLHPEAGSRGKETREAGTRLIEGPFEGLHHTAPQGAVADLTVPGRHRPIVGALNSHARTPAVNERGGGPRRLARRG